MSQIENTAMAAVAMVPDTPPSTTSTPSSSELQPTGRKVYATEGDWDPHKATISALYESYPLPEVINFMLREHGFLATKRQYKRKFKAWGVVKRERNSRSQEQPTRCNQRRACPQARNQPQRRWHHSHLHEQHIQQQGQFASLRGEIANNPSRFEQTLRLVVQYVGRSFSGGKWRFCPDAGMVLNQMKDVAGWRATTQFYNALQAATETLVKKGPEEAEALFALCLEDLTHVIPVECPKLLVRIWRSLGRHLRAIKAHNSPYARRLLKHFHDQATRNFQRHSELSKISALMMQLDLGNLNQLRAFDDLMTKLLLARSSEKCKMPAMAKHYSFVMNIGFKVSQESLEGLLGSAGAYMPSWRDVEGKLSLVKVLHQGKLSSHAERIIDDMYGDQAVWSFIQNNLELSGGFHYYSGLLKKERRDLPGAFLDLARASVNTADALGKQHGLARRRSLALEVVYHDLQKLTAGVA